ncbi:MAG: hypothetical protein AAF900_01915 [Bacteroidota bacterium]
MEQLHNESNQNNTIRNLLLILLVIIVGMGSFMIYNTIYNTPSPKTSQNNKGSFGDIPVEALESKIQTWLSNTYHSLTAEGRMVVQTIGGLLVVRYILWPILRGRKKTKNSR